ncbi:MAG: PP2C family protein-serine/threonine phosphatase [Leptospira sp.]|nr:PP2C family protein-serine/threonine phosphatase [Leptospira sp.]
MKNQLESTEETPNLNEKGYRFQLTDYYKKRIQEIHIEMEIKAEVFASKFRFFFIGFLVFVALLSRLGGRPVEELYYQLGGISFLLGFNIFVFFLLKKSSKEGIYYPKIKFFASFFEMTTLTGLLWYFVISSQNPTHVYSGAMSFIYFIFMSLASIRNRRSVIYFAGGIAILQYLGLMFYFYGDIKPILDNMVEYTDIIAPLLSAKGEVFKIVSIAPVSFILKAFYMAMTGFLIVYSISNANETSRKQSELIFNTEKKAILEENLRLGMELDVARQLQAMVLPNAQELKDCKDLEVAALMEAATEVGGDYYDVYPMANGSTYFAIGDVTGHGLQSGVIMMMTQCSFRSSIERGGQSLSEILNNINSVLFGNIQGRMKDSRNLTLSLFQYKEGKIYLTGQHEDFLIKRQNEPESEIIETMDLGIYIGLTDDIKSMVSEKEIEFNVGDVFLGYTDGVTEAENSKKEYYGHDRMKKKFEEIAHLPSAQIVSGLYEDLRLFIGETEVFDDISYIVVKRKS